MRSPGSRIFSRRLFAARNAFSLLLGTPMPGWPGVVLAWPRYLRLPAHGRVAGGGSVGPCRGPPLGVVALSLILGSVVIPTPFYGHAFRLSLFLRAAWLPIRRVYSFASRSGRLGANSSEEALGGRVSASKSGGEPCAGACTISPPWGAGRVAGGGFVGPCRGPPSGVVALPLILGSVLLPTPF